MEYRELGKTGLKVSRLCYGTLTLAPQQKNKSLQECRELFSVALDLGINFFDTADLYDNYNQIKELIKLKLDAIVCTKSYDYSKEGVKQSLEKALRGIGRDYVDIYMLHEQENKNTIQGHWEAIEYLMKMKEKGLVRAIGISTHRVEGVVDFCDFPELDVVFPITNYTGIGIEDGTRQDMELALEKASQAQKGIMGMKPFGGGNLLLDVNQCFNYVLSLKTLDSIAFGMQSEDEIRFNVARVNGEIVPENVARRVQNEPRKLHISDWCIGCGACVKRCGQSALTLVKGQAVVDQAKCLTCSYCASVCPMFCIKVI